MGDSISGGTATTLQGIPISTNIPADGDVLKFDMGSDNWIPAVDPEGGSGPVNFTNLIGRATSAQLPLGPDLYDNAGTPKLAVDFNARKIYATDGLTVIADFNDAVAVLPFSSLGSTPTTAVNYGIVGGAYLDALTGTAAARGLGKSIHITTTRIDGRSGTGTPEDPLVATGGDLHAIWSTVVAAAPSYVELAKATYTVSDILTPIANCWINANGATIQCTSAFGVDNTHKSIFSGGYNVDYSHFILSGGTFDGNLSGQVATKAVISAFLFYGSYNLAEWNTFKNFGSKSDSGVECFMGGFWASNVVKGYGNTIQNNYVTSVVSSGGGQATLFFLNGADVGVMDDFTEPSEMWQHGGRILNNTFNGIGTTGSIIQCIELGAWSCGETIAGNKFHHVLGSCIYTDTGSTWDNVVRDNYGEDVRFGINITNANNGSTGLWFNRRLTLENNQMFAQTTIGAGYDIVVQQGSGGYGAHKNYDLIVRGNKAGTYWNGAVANVGIILRGLSGGVVSENWVDPSVGSSSGNFAYDHCSGVTFRNNQADLYDGGNNSGTILAGFDHTTGTIANSNLPLGAQLYDSNSVLSANLDNRQLKDYLGNPSMDFSGDDSFGQGESIFTNLPLFIGRPDGDFVKINPLGIFTIGGFDLTINAGSNVDSRNNRTLAFGGSIDIGGNLTTATGFSTTGTSSVTLAFPSSTARTYTFPAASDGLVGQNGSSVSGLTGLGIRSTGAAHDLVFASSEAISTDRVLSLNVGNASRTLTLSGNPTLGDWFNQSVKTTATPSFSNVVVAGNVFTGTIKPLSPTLSPWIDFSGSADILAINSGSGGSGGAVFLSLAGLSIASRVQQFPDKDGTFAMLDDITTYPDGQNIALGTSTGTKIGTSTSQKLGFWNSTPSTQPTAVANASGGAVIDAEGRTALNALLARLRTIGIIAT